MLRRMQRRDLPSVFEDRDERIRYERADIGISIPTNFKRAFRLSRGRYFKWHAHDDLLDPEFLSQMRHDLE